MVMAGSRNARSGEVLTGYEMVAMGSKAAMASSEMEVVRSRTSTVGLRVVTANSRIAMAQLVSFELEMHGSRVRSQTTTPRYT
ncbi:hypothetical protein GUJ93_ZPchr0008g12910 [Zizania palustris]|uniref:Uncharacterized protein n=1 Tax=Zizania palustris TaxID=103762 RepID=A0A8J5RCB3_ZIZPA|nr:hypothetical protein GUJ93_ZPchr0008g12910 [Zizania palustris]